MLIFFSLLLLEDASPARTFHLFHYDTRKPDSSSINIAPVFSFLFLPLVVRIWRRGSCWITYVPARLQWICSHLKYRLKDFALCCIRIIQDAFRKHTTAATKGSHLLPLTFVHSAGFVRKHTGQRVACSVTHKAECYQVQIECKLLAFYAAQCCERAEATSDF